MDEDKPNAKGPPSEPEPEVAVDEFELMELLMYGGEAEEYEADVAEYIAPSTSS